MQCFYHKSDLDGHCSGAIVKQYFPTCEMIGVNYLDTVDRAKVSDITFVVDFSFSPEDMAFLADHSELHWLDHHKTAIEKLEALRNVKGIREIGRAGCELTWDYLVNSQNANLAVHLLGRYDVWDHSDPRTLPFQYGMRTFEDTRPNSNIWTDIFEDKNHCIAEIIELGKTIIKYEDKQNAMYAQGMAYDAVLEGLRVVVINKAYANSKIFDSVYDPEKHDAMVLFGVKPGEFKYSIYSVKPDIDVSTVAIKYGGGGHKGAAGFYSKTPVV